MSSRVAVVTGGNKGIGFCIVKFLCQQFDGDVFLTARDETRGKSSCRAPHGPRLARPGTRPAALGEPAPTREVPDCPPPSRRASQGPGLARTSPVWLPATERRFVHSALNPCCCYVVATPDIYLTTITSSQGLNQPTASWSPSTATERLTVLAWQDLGRGLLLSENPHLRARFQIVHRRRDERRKVLAWRGRALSGYRLPSDGTQPAHSLLVPKHRHELFPLLRPHARVVNLSSVCGMLKRIPGKEIRERLRRPDITLEGLCGLMNEFVQAAKEGKNEEKDPREDLVVNAVHPGYVDTDMTSHKGPLTPDQGADAPTYLAMLPPNVKSPKGEFVWNDRTVTPWDE
ncbi:hypothetical protein MRX96_020976 [Rhipicephalus microplus]